MMRISVVGTVHEEAGHANASELLAILLRIRPEVLFLEMPPSAVADYSNGSRSNIESIAVNRYRELHHADVVPVDLPTPDAEFFWQIEELSRSIRTMSPDYCRLVSWDGQYVETYGFAYLNSDHCSALMSDLHAARLAALTEIADHRLVEIYELWTRTNELRDVAMLKNIESYCARTSFRTGAFLVGAAHRQSLAEKSVAHTGSELSPICWDFFDFL